MVTIRDARLPQDAAAIRSIDTSFTTDVIYDVETADHALSLKARRLSSPLRKRFPLDDLDDAARRWWSASSATAEIWTPATSGSRPATSTHRGSPSTRRSVFD
jgi:hypothetical protein